jgi:Domain of unknown function (DUF4129)
MSAGPDTGQAASHAPRLTPALVVVGLVTVVAMVAAAVGGGWSLEPRVWFDGMALSGDHTPQMMAPPSLPPSTQQPGPAQQWIGWLTFAILVLGVLAGLFYLGRWLWQHRPRRAVVIEEKPDTTPAGVVAEVDLPTLLRGAESAETILAESGGVPRDLVLRCWLALEEAAASSGAARRPAQSPTEFAGTVLRSTSADPDAADTLLHLYHQARFSTHPLTDDDVRAARSAVVKLAATWRSFDTAMRHTARIDSTRTHSTRTDRGRSGS